MDVNFSSPVYPVFSRMFIEVVSSTLSSLRGKLVLVSRADYEVILMLERSFYSPVISIPPFPLKRKLLDSRFTRLEDYDSPIILL